MPQAARPRLSVNLNKIALLRNARHLGIPSVIQMAQQCIAAGVQGITVHPRSDQRHIRPDDVFALVDLLAHHPDIEYNIEGNPFDGLMAFAREAKPHQCTLVPDSPEQSTSDHGWDAAQDGARLQPVIEELQALGIRVSVFMDPDLNAISRIAELGPDRIELYTEPYAAAFGGTQQEAVFEDYRRATAHAQKLGLGVNAGHDLNLHNLPDFVRIPGILECSIGHALIADALSYGMKATVRKYLQAIAGQHPDLSEPL